MLNALFVFILMLTTSHTVEHPVTEAVTGYDIPELMFRIAAGEILPFTQADVRQHGWAIEARVYAENPFRGFLPSLGTIFGYEEPSAGLVKIATPSIRKKGSSQVVNRAMDVGFDSAGIRVDSGIADGVVVSSFYDPLLSKVIAYGDSRDAAIDRLGDALDSYIVGGIQTNIPFLRAVTRNDRFRTGDITTNFVTDEFADTVSGAAHGNPEGTDGKKEFGAGVTLNKKEMGEALAVVGNMYFEEATAGLSYGLGKPEPLFESVFVVSDVNGVVLCAGSFEFVDATGPMFVVIQKPPHIGEPFEEVSHVNQSAFDQTRFSVHSVTKRELAGGDWALVGATVNGNRVVLSRRSIAPYGGDGLWKVSYRGAVLDMRIGRATDEMLVRQIGGWLGSRGGSAGAGLVRDGLIRAPMAGHVVSIAVEVGDAVDVGQEVIVLEAMKMQNSLKSDVAGVVLAVRDVGPGDAVAIDQPLVEIEVVTAQDGK
jgi:propionyl-CoA carboxylase alpha chain